MITPVPPRFTGKHEGVFYIDGTNAKRVVEAMEARGYIKFPALATRNWVLRQGPRPPSQFDLLPDEPEENQG